jgi:transcriptional regulator with XRE-family HTH domain
MRELRLARGLSQARLAQLSGVSERTVRAIEADTVTRQQHESLRRIATVLAYGDHHRDRLVARWTGADGFRTHDELGVPASEELRRRVVRRLPDEGGMLASSLTDVTIGPDRLPLRCSYTDVHEAMHPDGSPVLWKLSGKLPFDVTTIRYTVRTGGVIDDFSVHDGVVALAIRPEPALAHSGPFVVQYDADFSDALVVDGRPETEWMFGATTPMRTRILILRFDGPVPQRLWSVRGSTARTAERTGPVTVSPDGTAQVTLHDFVGVFGIQWEWGDDPDGERQKSRQESPPGP